ncbi:MAG: hypothetical protein ACXAE3_07875, partial [Candidatus Kariarchaeaceae archaeon]
MIKGLLFIHILRSLLSIDTIRKLIVKAGERKVFDSSRGELSELIEVVMLMVLDSDVVLRVVGRVNSQV